MTYQDFTDEQKKAVEPMIVELVVGCGWIREEAEEHVACIITAFLSACPQFQMDAEGMLWKLGLPHFKYVRIVEEPK